MIPAGKLRDYVTFRRRAADANGDRLGDWETDTAFSLSARIVYLRGGEQTLQGRMQGVQPVALTVRRCAASAALDNSWSVLNPRTGDVFNITAAEPTKDNERTHIDVLAVKDGSSGG